jgi:hypothetical protein
VLQVGIGGSTIRTPEDDALLPGANSEMREERKFVAKHHASNAGGDVLVALRAAYVRIRPHTSAYVSIRQHTSAYVEYATYVSIREDTNTSAYVSIRDGCSTC